MKEDSSLAHPNYSSFEKVVTDNFGFLERDYEFKFTGIHEVNDGPRDQGVIARYSQNEVRIEIGWSATEGSLAVLVKTNSEGLARAEKYVYFEPFVEYASSGKINPIVPQIYPGMSVGRIEKAMMQREKCFQDGVAGVVKILASRF